MAMALQVAERRRTRRSAGRRRHRAGRKAAGARWQPGRSRQGSDSTCRDAGNRAAAEMLDAPRLPDCDLYVTLEPCAMCAAAISFARIRRLYFGAYDPKGGGVENGTRFFGQPTCHHAPEVFGGIAETECSDLLKDFFRDLRD